METVIDNAKLVSALHWYFSSKNLALKNSLGFRIPMSSADHDEMAQHYSQYFVSLMSATDMLRDGNHIYREDFNVALESGFVFDGFPNGLDNYGYVWELRNGIVHRGLALANVAVHQNGDLPMLVAPPIAESKENKKKPKRRYSAFGYYILEIISKCESTIGAIIAAHLKRHGLLDSRATQEELLREAIEFLNCSEGVPEHVKLHGSAALAAQDLVAGHEAKMKQMAEVFNSNALAPYNLRLTQ